MLDALVDRQYRQVAAAAQAAMVEHLLKAAQHRRRTVRESDYAVDEIRARQLQAGFRDALADVAQQAFGLGAQQLDDVAHDRLL